MKKEETKTAMERKCDYCEKNEATRTMADRCISRFIKSGRLISNETLEPTKYWCDECWNLYD